MRWGAGAHYKDVIAENPNVLMPLQKVMKPAAFRNEEINVSDHLRPVSNLGSLYSPR
jgi:hypothetical protein